MDLMTVYNLYHKINNLVPNKYSLLRLQMNIHEGFDDLQTPLSATRLPNAFTISVKEGRSMG